MPIILSKLIICLSTMQCSKNLFCAIPGCGLRGDNTENKPIKFHKFPSFKDEFSKNQRRIWLKVAGSHKVTKFMRICSRHFESGKNTAFHNWTPTLNLTGSCNTTEIQFPKVVIRRARDLDNRLEINLENFVGDNRKVQYFTGIKTYAQMASIYDDVKPELSASTLTKFKVFYITLVRLRLNLNFGYFAFTFNVSVKAISDAFKCGLQALYSRLVPLIECPERQILSNRDESFQQLIEENDLYAIVDCREFQVSKLPGTRTIESVKFLFGYTIQGSICFISKGYNASQFNDDHITRDSGFLDHLQDGDGVLAGAHFMPEDLKLTDDDEDDDGTVLHDFYFRFLVKTTENSLQPKGMKELIQQNGKTIEEFVERVIGRLEKNFQILSKSFSKSQLTKMGAVGSDASEIEMILTVCSGILNYNERPGFN